MCSQSIYLYPGFLARVIVTTITVVRVPVVRSVSTFTDCDIYYILIDNRYSSYRVIA